MHNDKSAQAAVLTILVVQEAWRAIIDIKFEMTRRHRGNTTGRHCFQTTAGRGSHEERMSMATLNFKAILVSTIQIQHNTILAVNEH